MEWLERLGLLGLFLGSALAASIFPFSSDALYIAILAATKEPVGCLIAGTAGSWVGKWEWIEKWLEVSHENLEKHQKTVQKYGAWLGLVSGVPVIGDILVLALGFYRTQPLWTFILLLVGKILRFLIWNLVVGAF